MIGIFIELLVSWLLLWIFLRKHLSVLGFMPNKNRIFQFITGFLIAAICCVSYHFLSIAFIDNKWKLNNAFTLKDFISGSWWTFKSVLYEELLFRGALLYILIKKLSVQVACIISAVEFGVYHWFSYNVIGNPFMMFIVFIMTAFAGWIFAYAFARTMSLYLPVALHFGYNLVNIIIFSNGPLAPQMVIKENNLQPVGFLSLALFIFQMVALPMITLWYLIRFRRVVK